MGILPQRHRRRDSADPDRCADPFTRLRRLAPVAMSGSDRQRLPSNLDNRRESVPAYSQSNSWVFCTNRAAVLQKWQIDRAGRDSVSQRSTVLLPLARRLRGTLRQGIGQRGFVQPSHDTDSPLSSSCTNSSRPSDE
jgi:hypothetical protein